jgi:DNA-binding beta-propeller fold protein YncE
LGPATSYFWAGDFVGADLTKTYVIRDDNTLMTVNAATGAETSIGTLAAPPGGETYTGMTFDPATGNVYATSCNITTSSLFTIDVLTATSTRIGAITNSPCSIGIGADDSGNLYTYDLVNDSFLSVNKTTGAGTIIGSLGFDANYGQGMDFDSVTGTMYLAAFNNATFQAEFRAVDLATGNTTLLGALGTPGVTQLGYVAFQSGGPCSSPSDLPWLSVNPISGTTRRLARVR